MADHFTQAQERAIDHFKGPALVLAGPGSGKTLVITERVCRLIAAHQVPASQILVITFTKAAAVQMEERFSQKMPQEHPWFGTFHSFFYYILRTYSRTFPRTLIPANVKQSILRSACKTVLQDTSQGILDAADQLLGLYINLGLDLQKLPVSDEIGPKDVEAIYRIYADALKQEGYFDFDDLQISCLNLLRSNLEIRRRIVRVFPFILVDECQDMNPVQYEILKLLTGPEKSVLLVGDDDQSVYRFRGADVSLMRQFLRDYSPVTEILLDQNFRSAKCIVEASMKVIADNKTRFEKTIRPKDGVTQGVVIRSFQHRLDMNERISSFLREQPDLSKCAVICRTNRELGEMARRLRRENISYQMREAAKSVFEEDWYLDLEAYLKLGQDINDRKYILRVANKPNRFITREQIVNFPYPPATLVVQVKHLKGMRPALALKYIWIGIGYGRYLKNSLEREEGRYEEILEQYEEIAAEMEQYPDVKDWLDYVESERQLERKESRNKTNQSETGVHLMTMHGSKGLEYETVILPDLNEGRMPRGSHLSDEEIEEERRLLYVAMTRAKKSLEIYYISGEEGHLKRPSMFLHRLAENKA
ncbi:MAG: ATP-dependent helicase [Lachnospiraceae bacterium]|nr:ATP-dependent helicase [Lachnospiraceae bacterium]